MGRYWWKVWPILLATVLGGYATYYYGFLYNDHERYEHRVAVERAANRYRETARCVYSAEWCSGPLYWWASFRQSRLRREWQEAKVRVLEAKVARAERCQLPVETPVEPALLALR